MEEPRPNALGIRGGGLVKSRKIYAGIYESENSLERGTRWAAAAKQMIRDYGKCYFLNPHFWCAKENQEAACIAQQLYAENKGWTK